MKKTRTCARLFQLTACLAAPCLLQGCHKSKSAPSPRPRETIPPDVVPSTGGRTTGSPLDVLPPACLRAIEASPQAPAQPQANDLFVSPQGSDTATGAPTAPLRSVATCLGRIAPGAACVLREGTYRESITLGRSGEEGKPLILRSFPGEKAILSGADPITGWQVHDVSNGRRIYKAAMAFTMDPAGAPLSRNQILLDGEPQIHARWPNLPDSKNHTSQTWKEWAHAEAAQSLNPAAENGTLVGGIIDDPALGTVAPGALQGAFLTLIPGANWTPTSGLVTGVSGNRITFEFNQIKGDSYLLQSTNNYYAWGSLALLDTAREWYRDPQTGTLYLWFPEGTSPDTARVEAQARDVVLNFGTSSHVLVEGITIQAGRLTSATGSSHITLRDIKVGNAFHYEYFPGGWQGGARAVHLGGSSHRIVSSDVVGSAAACIEVNGDGNVVVNTVARDCAYAGLDGANLQARGSHSQILCNTVQGSGSQNALDSRENLASKLLHNDVSQAGRLLFDGGAVMVARNTKNADLSNKDEGWSRIAYNHIHGNDISVWDSTHKYWGTSGIYFEGNIAGFKIDHNAIRESSASGISLVPGTDMPEMTRIRLVNNSVAGSFIYNQNAALKYTDVLIANNIFEKLTWGTLGYEVIFTKNHFANKLWDHNFSFPDFAFRDAQKGDLTLPEASPAIDRGEVVPDVTDGFSGSAPDLGAYESGQSPWHAGAVR